MNIWDLGQDGGEGRGREKEATTVVQIHTTPHNAARSLGEM